MLAIIIINGSKIYDTNHIVDFYVGHLNPAYFPSGLGNVFLILLMTHDGSGRQLSCPTIPQHHLTNCLYAVYLWILKK